MCSKEIAWLIIFRRIEKIPFVLDTCEETFSGIDLLLNEVWDGLDGRREW